MFFNSMMRRANFFPALIVALAALTVSGCEKPPEQALGTLEWDRVNNRIPASEIIIDIKVTEGEQVSAGTVLLSIDDRKIAQQYKDIQARLEQASWLLKERETGPRPQTIAEAKARLEAARATLENNEEIYRRQQYLLKSEFASQQQVDIARSSFLNARERVSELTESLNKLQIGTRIEQIEQARASVASLTSQLENLQLLWNDYTIKASRTGLVDSLPFKKGDRPPAGAVVSTILSGDKPWARVYIPEHFRSRMKHGDTYNLKIDGQEHVFTVRLRTLSSEASFTPYYALSEKDRSRLSYVAQLDFVEEKARDLTAGAPVQLLLEEM